MKFDWLVLACAAPWRVQHPHVTFEPTHEGGAVRRLTCRTILALLALAIPASAGEQATAEFSLPGAKFVLPLPKGYCLPTGDYETNAKMTAAADTTNLTDVSFYGCDDMAAGTLTTWGALKTPFSAVNASDNKLQDLVDYFKNQ